MVAPEARPKRGPKPALTLPAIAEAAIAVADAEGLAAVSMQRVAADLGYTKMSLYRYLPGKAELVALMLEQAIGAPPEPAPGGWRAGLEDWARRLLERYLVHPWAVEATVGKRPLGPYEMGWMEAALAHLRELPLTGAERLDTIAVLAGHGRMLAQQSAAMLGEREMTTAMAAVMRAHGDRFPHLPAAMADAGQGADQAFEYGLARILDGVEGLVSRR
ncbi:TetR/AcrR family transcriptional regulator C-terminal domain-containing protein [Actinoplanes sp. N902-109]|uniref:TetR/AcrR family transcriptional regulator C-terminal domain-containing protein n=1 Tax=Actinoplanes sp. (strain N902-109) TaxID=649831 RepID=UPI0003296023|nr:TetR/AcrR family transcriptional regulator C-terminal domain-containing protein [Actinoplanes sp. N902-109]AGL19712.1 TetR family transcriptional regulator [Actinoplanes sp. N902-109]